MKHLTREQFGDAFESGGFRRTIAVLVRIGAGIDDAEEFAQAAWVRGWERLHQLRDEARVVEWVTSSAVRMFLTQVTSRRMTALSSAGFDVEIEPAVNPEVIDLCRALDRSRQKALLQEVYVYGRSVGELADGRCSAGALYHRLSRARGALRREIRPEF